MLAKARKKQSPWGTDIEPPLKKMFSLTNKKLKKEKTN